MPPKKPTVSNPPKPTGRTPARTTAKPGPAVKGAASKKPPVTATKTAGAKKGVTPAKGKGAPPTKQPPERKWTKQDDAARTIQTCARSYIAKKELAKRRKEKQDYEELIERLEKEAFVALVKMQQEELEKQRLKEEEERRRRREDQKRRKRMLEAAFDGDDDDIKAVLKEVEKCDDQEGLGHDMIGEAKRKRHQLDMVECEDPNGNTALSEAAGGGSVSTIKMLIELGANPNTQGHFKRTPLYRAAFGGHLEACQLLLSYGADPRIYADDGTTPEQVASVEPVKELLMNWDMEQTDMLLEKLSEMKQQRNEEDRVRREAEVRLDLISCPAVILLGTDAFGALFSMEKNIKDVEKQYQVKQKQLVKAHEELEKRIFEHDEAIAQGFENKEILTQAIHDAETGLEMARLDAEKIQQKLQDLRLEMREANQGDEKLPGVKANIKELDEVLLRDVGNKIADSGKWPLLIDATQKASTFLRYRDTNYINALNPKTMEKDRVRMAIVGALRFGKPVVLDMMGVDIYDVCAMRFDEVQEGLMKSIMDKSIMQEEKFKSLLREADGDDYVLKKFNDQRTRNFKFILITQVPFPPEDLLDKVYPISVVCG